VGGAQPDGGIDWATAQISVYARSCFLMEVTAGHCRDGSMISGSAAAARQARGTTATTSQARGPGPRNLGGLLRGRAGLRISHGRQPPVLVLPLIGWELDRYDPPLP
jgi:hypothetical protein